ncbi:hypothetical protein GQ42DRAFT_29521 [Ramicandelaber brevisporus]|nr:hypothetical protein GQ42DRAFT_29521 [Ramicandelaber brevisporus]
MTSQSVKLKSRKCNSLALIVLKSTANAHFLNVSTSTFEQRSKISSSRSGSSTMTKSSFETSGQLDENIGSINSLSNSNSRSRSRWVTAGKRVASAESSSKSSPSSRSA